MAVLLCKGVDRVGPEECAAEVAGWMCNPGMVLNTRVFLAMQLERGRMVRTGSTSLEGSECGLGSLPASLGLRHRRGR